MIEPKLYMNNHWMVLTIFSGWGVGGGGVAQKSKMTTTAGQHFNMGS